MQHLAEKMSAEDFQVDDPVRTKLQPECPKLTCSSVYIENRTIGQGNVFAVYDGYILVRHINGGIAAYLRSELSQF